MTDCVEIGTKLESEMDKIVTGVDDDSKFFGVKHSGQSKRELGTSDSAGQRQNHRNRSFTGGRTRSIAFPSPLHVSPRTITMGRASSPWPISSDADAAISSAVAT